MNLISTLLASIRSDLGILGARASLLEGIDTNAPNFEVLAIRIEAALLSLPDDLKHVAQAASAALRSENVPDWPTRTQNCHVVLCTYAAQARGKE